MNNTYKERNIATKSEYELNQFVLKNRKNLNKSLIDFIAGVMKEKEYDLYSYVRVELNPSDLESLALKLLNYNNEKDNFLLKSIKISEDFKKNKDFSIAIKDYLNLYNEFEPEKITNELSILLKQKEDLIKPYVETIISLLKKEGKIRYSFAEAKYVKNESGLTKEKLLIKDEEMSNIVEKLYKIGNGSYLSQKQLSSIIIEIFFAGHSLTTAHNGLIETVIKALLDMELLTFSEEYNMYMIIEKINKAYNDFCR